MRKRQAKSDAGKSKALAGFEYILLGLCLAVIALRTTFAESPTIQSVGATGNLYETVYSLSVSAVLIFSFIIRLVWSLCGGRFSYRRSGIEIGLCVFLAAAVIAGLVAPDQRLAISNFAVLIAPILMALLLVQILDSAAKVKLVLVVIAALGVVNAQRSAEQFLGSNQATIAEYEKDPETQLELRGIEPNSLNAFLFEHRVCSGGISGYFITRNSAASFGLLASFVAVALFIDQLRNRKADSSGLPILACGIAAAGIIFSLVITRSKGAFIGLFFAAILFVIFLRFGDWLKNHRKAIFIVCLLLGILGLLAVAAYGLTRGRLPGGNSMLVRWQYWQAAAGMYADHPFTGVGPGGFSDYYTHYKPDAALEAVTDPHNFPLSILTQYGPLGLAGFLAMILLPLWKVLSPQSPETSPKAHDSGDAFGKKVIVFAIIVSVAMLVVRQIILPLPAAISPQEKLAGILILYIMPVFVFLVGLLLVAVGERAEKKTHPSVIGAALFAAVTGLLIHNLMDFAIFEPGVFTTFWAVIACLIATHCNETPDRRTVPGRTAPVMRLVSIAAGFAVIAAYLNYALIPVVRSTAKIRQADLAVAFGRFDLVHELLDSAARDDPLSPAALTLDGRLHLRSFEMNQKQNPELLLMAEKSLKTAISRNSVEFKNFERLTRVYILLAETAAPNNDAAWLNKAFDSASQAVERYPGCARLRVQIARIAEQLGKVRIAIEQYQKAIDIEESYRRQFRTIYPERKDIVSRLGDDKYLFAKDRLKALSD